MSALPDGRSLEGRVAVVTGGAKGIGLAISRRLARDGARVAVLDLDGPAVDAAVADITAEGHEVAGWVIDASDRAQIEDAATAIRERFGPVTVLVNNAGVSDFSSFMTSDEDSWRRVMDINVMGPFHCTQVFVPDMIGEGWGRVINISSSSAQRGSKMVAYSASKGAIIAFTKSLALELGPHGITVNNIPPNMIVTPMHTDAVAKGFIPAQWEERVAVETPVGRPGEPEDIAAAVSYLASPEAGYVTAQTIGVNGGRFP